MLRINKNEMEYLSSNGFKFHDTLHKTYSGNTHYYVTEGTKVLNFLKKYRENHIIESHA